jgi:hypothetical protein
MVRQSNGLASLKSLDAIRGKGEVLVANFITFSQVFSVLYILCNEMIALDTLCFTGKSVCNKMAMRGLKYNHFLGSELQSYGEKNSSFTGPSFQGLLKYRGRRKFCYSELFTIE